MDAHALDALDREGWGAYLAVDYVHAPKQSSLAYPHAFVCDDGETYWVKRFRHSSFVAGQREAGAQQGLLAELVAGRLGHQLVASSAAAVVNVPTSLRRDDGSIDHLLGVGVGLEDQDGMENLRYLADQMPSGALATATLDLPSVARVIVFHSWIGAADAQIMIDLRAGRVMSVDHGDYAAFQSDTPSVVVAPDLPPNLTRDAQVIEPEVERIEALTDEQILAAVSRVPAAAEWRADRQRRVALAEALGLRRDRLGSAMSQWTT